MNVEMRPIAKVKPYKDNPRTISEAAVRKVAASLKEFGWRQPLVVDKDGVLIVGHTRLQAAQSLGMVRVPVLVAADLSPSQVRAYRIADNRTNEESEWNDEVLADELEALLGEDESLLAVLGFDQRELDRLLADEDEIARAEITPDVPEDPVSAVGDVWILGRHRIVCGDSTDAAVVSRCLAGARPNLMVTDPPYGVEYDASWRDKALGKGDQLTGTAKGKVLNDDRADWREVWALFPGAVAYVWHGALHDITVAQSLIAAGFDIRAQIVWAKSALALSRGHYHWQHEPCFYAVRGLTEVEKRFALARKRARGGYSGDHGVLLYGVRRVKGGGSWHGDRKQSTLWHIDKPKKNETGHSTQKPVDCMRRPILNNSSMGDVVFEPFSGSGTTIMAAELTGRSCHAIELSPAYVDVAALRWQGFTDRPPVLEATGETFEAVSKRRHLEREALKNPPAPVDAPSEQCDLPNAKRIEKRKKAKAA